VLGFLGPNGAGKTTTMRIVAGFLPATDGRVTVCGFDVDAQATEAKRRIGYLPEGAPCYPEMTPRTFLEFIAAAREVAPQKRKARLDEVFQQLHLEKVLDQTIDTLSKGYKRRVGLAQAIVHDPEVLILDEPTDGLDPNQKHEVRELIGRMAKSKIIVISTHLLEEVEAVCNRAIIIAHGKILADDTPQGLAGRVPSRLEGLLINLTERLPNVTRRSAPDSARPDRNPGFATHALAEVLRLGKAVEKTADRAPPKAAEFAFMLNDLDRTVSMAGSLKVAKEWDAHGARVSVYAFPASLRLPHNVLDGREPGGQPALVLPEVIALTEGESPRGPLQERPLHVTAKYP